MGIGLSYAGTGKTRKMEWETIGYRTTSRLDPVFAWVTRYATIYKNVRVLQQEIYPVYWFQFQTRGDERTCPECGPINGRQWPEGAQTAPSPPLHVNCRCSIVQHRVEYRRRNVWSWQSRAFSIAISDYKQIGNRTITQRTEVKGWVQTGWIQNAPSAKRWK